MSRTRRHSPSEGNAPERLPLRWGLILIAAVGAGTAAFAVGGPLAAIGLAALIVSTLHKVLV